MENLKIPEISGGVTIGPKQLEATAEFVNRHKKELGVVAAASLALAVSPDVLAQTADNIFKMIQLTNESGSFLEISVPECTNVLIDTVKACRELSAASQDACQHLLNSLPDTTGTINYLGISPDGVQIGGETVQVDQFIEMVQNNASCAEEAITQATEAVATEVARVAEVSNIENGKEGFNVLWALGGAVAAGVDLYILSRKKVVIALVGVGLGLVGGGFYPVSAQIILGITAIFGATALVGKSGFKIK